MTSPTSKISASIADLLRSRGESLSTAESITGGLIASAITDIAGASEVFRGGIIAYSNEVKMNELDISAAMIEKDGVVSESIAIAMAKSARKKFHSTWAISSTGVAGPGPAGGVAAGTAWIGIAGPDFEQGIEISITGTREIVRSGAVESALGAFERILSLS